MRARQQIILNILLTSEEKISCLKENFNNDTDVRLDGLTGKYLERDVFSGFGSEEERIDYLQQTQGFAVNMPDGHGLALLHMCAMTNDIKVAQWLIECQGANVDLALSVGFGRFPLLFAAREGQLAMTKYLMSKGADINLSTSCECDSSSEGKTFVGTSSMHAAVRYGHWQIVEFLLSRGAAIRKDSRGKTPIELAIHLLKILPTLESKEEHQDSEKYFGVKPYRNYGKVPSASNLKIIVSLLSNKLDCYIVWCTKLSLQPISSTEIKESKRDDSKVEDNVLRDVAALQHQRASEFILLVTATFKKIHLLHKPLILSADLNIKILQFVYGNFELSVLKHVRKLEVLASPGGKIVWDKVWPCRPTRLLDYKEEKLSIKKVDPIKEDAIAYLKDFLKKEIARLNQLQFYVKGLDDKRSLYSKLLARFGTSDELKDNDLSSIIKECALVAHHKRYSKWDSLASTCSLGFFCAESTSWIQWKQLCTRIDKVTDQAFKKLFNDTLAGKEGRRISHENSEIDDYNHYRTAKLASFG